PATIQNQYVEFSNATLYITHESEISDDVIKHTLPEAQSALAYGSICLPLDDIPTFLRRINHTQLRTCFTIFVQTSEKDPHKWHLESTFPEIHYSHHSTTITRSRLVDADQAHPEFGFLNTTVGRQIYRKYLDIYRQYYDSEKWKIEPKNTQAQLPVLSQPTAPYQHSSVSSPPPKYSPNISSVPSHQPNYSKLNIEESHPHSNLIKVEKYELKPLISRSERNYPKLANEIEQVIDYTPQTKMVAKPTDDHEDDLQNCKSTYAPILYSQDRHSHSSSLFRSLLCCVGTSHKFLSRVGLEKYDNALYKGVREKVTDKKNLTGLEVLCNGDRIKRDVKKKTFYHPNEVEKCATPFQLCEYIASQWSIDIEVLLPLVHHVAKNSDQLVATLIKTELKKVIDVGTKHAKRNQRYSVLIGKRCNGCVYDQVAYDLRLHYHSEFLDKLYHLDPEIFRRFTLLAFELLKRPLNIQKD
ncbi:hypothetical protein TUBRATIS_29580, partial [Tubulinosema ratisbonensis]